MAILEDISLASEAAEIAREAWTQGTLAADNIVLREVIHELRRYRKGHLSVADEIAELKVYGNFPIQDTDRVLRMLASALPIRIEQPLPWWTSIEAQKQSDSGPTERQTCANRVCISGSGMNSRHMFSGAWRNPNAR